MTELTASKQVLVIDREPAARMLICEFLKMEGLRADSRSSLGEASELCRAKEYAMATLSLQMPYTDGSEKHGFSFAQVSHAQPIPHLLPRNFPPVLIVTGNGQDPWVSNLLDGHNVVGVLVKPLSYESFSVTVRRIWLQLEARKRTAIKKLQRLR